jgi:hypothetical protein
MSTRKQVAILLTVVAAAASIPAFLAGCGSDGTEASSSEPSTTAAASPESGSSLEGTWRAGPISTRDAETTLRRSGLGKWVEPLRPLMPFAGATTLILDIEEGEWDLYGESPGGQREEIDYDAEYVVKRDTVEKIHATGVTTLRWAVDGDTLTLEWLKTTEPPVSGIPDEVFQRVLYMTRPFTRQG